MGSKLVAAGITSLLVSMVCLPGAVRAQAGWLDESSPASWNEAGASIPAAPPRDNGSTDSRCQNQIRQPDSAEDSAVVDRGWNLFGAEEKGGGSTVIMATANYDGMCRPLQYQVFVFADGTYAGTLSPNLMDGRTDGAYDRVSVQEGGKLSAQYLRYNTADPLCCPSRTTSVEFQIETSPDGPVVKPVSTSTTSKG